MTRPPEKSVPVSERDREEAKKLWESCCSWYGADHEGWCVAQMVKFREVARHEGRLEGLEEAAARCDARAKAVRDEAAKIQFGTRSGRRTFLKDCPAYDTERFIAVIIDEDATFIRALALPEGDAHE